MRSDAGAPANDHGGTKTCDMYRCTLAPTVLELVKVTRHGPGITTAHNAATLSVAHRTDSCTCTWHNQALVAAAPASTKMACR